MRVALDTNILAYVSGVDRAPGDGAKIVAARALIASLSEAATVVVPVQALGELFVVLRRSGVAASEAATTVNMVADSYETPASDRAAMRAALESATTHRLQYWDALILSVAADAGCTLLLSEDMQHGFAVRGVTIVNPLAAQMHPKLAALIGAR